LVDVSVPVATPEPLVVPAGWVSVLPVVGLAARITVAPETGFPLASLAVTVIVADVPSAAMGDEALTVDWLAETVPAVPVTENVTGEPVRPIEPAVTVLVPSVVPSVQVVSVACPVTSVWMTAGDAGLMEPFPTVTVNVTFTPVTGLLWASVTRTEGAVTELPTVAEAGGVLAELIRAAEPVVPVALNVTGFPPPENPVAVAVIELEPTEFPRIHEPIVAIPDELVVAGFVPVSDPLPVTTAKVTDA